MIFLKKYLTNDKILFIYANNVILVLDSSKFMISTIPAFFNQPSLIFIGQEWQSGPLAKLNIGKTANSVTSKNFFTFLHP